MKAALSHMGFEPTVLYDRCVTNTAQECRNTVASTQQSANTTTQFIAHIQTLHIVSITAIIVTTEAQPWLQSQSQQRPKLCHPMAIVMAMGFGNCSVNDLVQTLFFSWRCTSTSSTVMRIAPLISKIAPLSSKVILIK